MAQRLARGSGPRIHVDHPGGGLVMSIHLSDVGPHAITLGHSGGVNVARMAEHKLRSDAHLPATNPFHSGFGSRVGGGKNKKLD